MPQKGSVEHEKKLEEKLRQLEDEGWRTINLQAKSPDGIAVKDGKICAVEILKKIKVRASGNRRGKGKGKFRWKYAGGFTMANKRSNYDMFDDVIFDVYK